MPGISACLPDKVAPLRIASLELVTQILNGSSAAVQPFLDTLFKVGQLLLFYCYPLTPVVVVHRRLWRRC